MALVPPVRVESLESRTLLSVSLVADLNPTTPGTGPTNVTVVGQTAYFVRNPDGLWKTDGTVAGSALVAKFNSNTASISGLTALPAAGLLLFHEDGSIYRTDGTPAGTFPLAAVNDLPDSYYTDGVRAVWHISYSHWPAFEPHDELWASDGTVAGTHKVIDFATDVPGGYGFLNGAFNNGTFYFVTRTTAAGPGTYSLWASDGTPGGTRKVTDLGANDGSNYGGSAPSLMASGGMLFVVEPSGRSSITGGTTYSLLASDGTAAGTHAFASLASVDSNFLSGTIAAAHGRIFYRNNGGSLGGGVELWASDGTEAGTAMVKDIVPGRNGSYPDKLTPMLDGVVFNVSSTSNPGFYDQLWRSGGGADGTVEVAAVSTGAGNGASAVASASGKIYYAAGGHLFVAGPSPAQSVELTPSGVAQSSSLVPFRGGVLFYGTDTLDGNELWFTDGTKAGTRVIDLTTKSLDGGGAYFADLGGKAYFAANRFYDPAATTAADGITTALMTTDGTPAGTTIVKEGLTIVGPMLRSGNRLLFPAYELGAGTQLWATDGTPNGTVRLTSIITGASVTGHTWITDVGGTAFFVDTNNNLWRSDGTAGGTSQVTTGLTIQPLFRDSPVMAAGRTLYFTARAAATGTELYKVDLDAGGTPTLVKDIRPGTASSNPDLLGAVNGKLMFTVADGGGTYRHLWTSDGTDAGTHQVSDTGTESAGIPTGNRLHRAAVLNGALFFTGGAGTGDFGLWKSDGTAAGTVPVVRRPYGVGDVFAAGGKLFFLAGVGPGQTELTAGDGTEGGTVPLGQSTFVTADNFVAHAGRVFFTAQTATSGPELWSTDGTAADTHIESDRFSNPNQGVDASEGVAVAGGMLLFDAYSPDVGKEPRRWVDDGAGPGAVVVGRNVFYNNSAADGSNPAANADDDAAIAAGKAALLPGGFSGLENRTSYVRGLNGIMVDIAGLPAAAALSPDDFIFRVGAGGDPSTWPLLSGRPDVNVRRGAGVYGTDRVSLTWPDGAPARNAWLQVTVKAEARTGLARPDVFYFGNLAGDAGGSNFPARVDLADLVRVRAAVRAPDASYDFDGDRRITAADLVVVRLNLGRSLAPLAPPAQVTAPAAASVTGPVAVRLAAPRPRRAWDQIEPAT